MPDKLIRASFQTWLKLRAIAFHHNTHIKTVLDDIISGKITDLEILLE